MQAWNTLQRIVLFAGVAALSLPLPQLALAAETAPAQSLGGGTAPEVLDVRLNAEGRLAGQVLDKQGQPVAAAIVAVSADSGELSGATTSEEGEFAASVPRGGVYSLHVGEEATICRVWSAEAAPPHAQDAVLLVTGDVERARIYPLLPNRPMAQFLGNPWVITGLVVTAVVVPIALHNNRDDHASASGP